MGKKKGGGESKSKFSVLDFGKDMETGDTKKKKSKEKSSSSSGGKGEQGGLTKKQLRQKKQEELAKKKAAKDDYYGFMDLPPSDEDEYGYEEEGGQEEEKKLTAEEEKRLKKQAEKDALRKKRKEAEAMAASKEARRQAMLQDDSAFDVSFEAPQYSEEVLASVKDIKVNSLTVRAKGKILLENTAVTIAHGRKYGLVGPNGKGKSTLLRLLGKRQIPVPEGIDALLVEQEVVGDKHTALESVVMADVELMSLKDEEKELTAKMENLSTEDKSGEDSKIASRLTEVYDRLNTIGASSADARASKILHGLGFTPAMQGRATNTFSGGWRMRISLARALFIQPTLLMLDEPTNHLDLRAAIWLEEYLMRWKKTLIVVSHDRDFLDSVTTDIIHLHDERLHQYKGNYSTFEEMYEQRRKEANKAFDKYEKQMKAAKASGSRTKQDKVKQNQKQLNKEKKKGKKNKGNDDDINVNDAPRKWNDYTVQFEFPEPTELNPPLISLMDADFKYPGRDDFGMKNLNLGIDMGSRIAIVGPNGAGKSTLMNLLAGDIEPTSGDSRRSQKLRIGRYAQHFVDVLTLDVTPVHYLLEKFPDSGLRVENMRAKLGRFGLSGHHHMQPIVKLSGGQKARVVFAAISLSRPHILLLDEPTNHLDMQSVDALADAIEMYEGGVVIISHDSRLLSRVCEDEERSEVWIVDDGELETYDGDFEDYRDELVKEIAEELDEDEH
ncbi:ABC transporter [Chloropicon primus]|uniref:ABC transporter n=1 Tax=Chloropicon primus TaxID=1764295 RepID=A0A5B8MU41_9CHLO|nr:ABC transporter [Chloropicon primus]UPR03245.1 ABC transporter [Chloropicon primus]|mmetsp:Transcript_4923/g.14732  ORF Transcript_4923/g.14732 Transcript_4923/m.14732 type:complete len:725 (+) Transcript_4923:42-2216(+)|eukprot:QDZ24033.1 ABC transporter [Chloropicon primus]